MQFKNPFLITAFMCVALNKLHIDFEWITEIDISEYIKRQQ